MDLEELKKLHPETFASAHAEGVASERDRVTAHITLGTRFDQLPIAIEAIKDGSGLTLELSQKYIEAATCKLEQRAYQLDSDSAGAIIAGIAQGSGVGDRDFGDEVADLVCGKKNPS